MTTTVEEVRERITVRNRLRNDADVRFAVLVFLAGRVLMSGLGVIGWQLPVRPPDAATAWVPQPPAHDWQAAFTGLERYDAQWYLQIARDGYSPHDSTAAFFPLYPMLVRGLGTLLGHHWLLAAILVSNLALLGALITVTVLTRRELSPGVARWSAVLLVLSPVGFFLYAPYTESLFLLLCALCLLLLRQGRWWPAAACAALACATRSTGLVLALVLGVEALRQAGWYPKGRRAWRTLVARLAAVAVSTAGFLLYLAYWQTRTTWHQPTQALREYGRVPTPPWTTLWHGLKQTADQLADTAKVPFTVESVLGFVALALGVVAVRRYAPAYKVFTAAGLVMPLLMVIPNRPLTSIARYDLVVFPVTWVLAEARPRVRVAVVAVSSALLCMLTLLFVAWHPVL